MADNIEDFLQKLQFPNPPPKSDLHQQATEFDQQELFPALMELLVTTDDVGTKQTIITLLQHYQGQKSLKPLLDLLLEEEDLKVQVTIIKTLAILENPAAIGTLEKLVQRSSYPEVIQVASQAIQIIQGVASPFSIAEL